MPVLVEPIAAVEVFVDEPVHGDVIVLGIGTPISGLTPPLSISVAPSGIVPPFSVVLEVVPDVDSGEAEPLEVTPVTDAQLDVEPADPVEPNPLPSKVEFVPPDIEVIPDPLVPESPENEAPLALQFELAVELRPPGSISVAPSGMPVPPFDPVAALAPSMPSGEVAPRPDVIIALCAWAAPQPNRITATMRGKSLMERLRCYG